MNAITLLESEHDTMRKLLNELETTTERGIKTRQELFATIKGELTLHEVIEEEIFYPELKSHPKAKDIVLEGYQEHHVVDLLMSELEELDVSDETWGAKAKVMKENVEHHMEEEEGDMFKQARRVFDRAELDELGRRMEERRISAARELGIRSPRAGRARRAGEESLRAGRHTARSPRTPWPCEDGPAMRTIDWVDGEIQLIDQTRLPDELVVLRISELDPLIDAIAQARRARRSGAGRGRRVRGRAAGRTATRTTSVPCEPVRSACAMPGRRRSTSPGASTARCACLPDGPDAVLSEAVRIRDEDIAACAAMATRGADLIGELVARPRDPRDDDLQHRRARRPWSAGRRWASSASSTPAAASRRRCRSRPGRCSRARGSRPGSWPQMGAPFRLLVDAAAASVLVRGGADVVLIGADRIARTGTPPTRSAACRWRSRRVMPACRSWWSRRRRRSTRRPRRATGSRSRSAAGRRSRPTAACGRRRRAPGRSTPRSTSRRPG